MLIGEMMDDHDGGGGHHGGDVENVTYVENNTTNEYVDNNQYNNDYGNNEQYNDYGNGGGGYDDGGGGGYDGGGSECLPGFTLGGGWGIHHAPRLFSIRDAPAGGGPSARRY
jgi:hypothetical protein